MNIKRAIGISVAIYLAFFVVMSISALIMWYVLPFVVILFVCVGAFWYFKSPTVSASARQGFYFGLTILLIGFVLDILSVLPTLSKGDGLLKSLLDYYSQPLFWVMLVLILLVATLTGKKMKKLLP